MNCLSPPSVRRSAHRLVGALLGAATLFLGGCASGPSFMAQPPLMPSLKAALQTAPTPADAGTGLASAPAVAAAASAPPMLAATREEAGLPLPAGRTERRFSVVLNNATPEVLFMALLAETPLSVAVDPAVKGPISISLKDVTLREALDLLRELHGLEYKVIGRHILVSAAQLQTRIFTVDYPSFNRSGRSELRVLSGSITGNAANSAPGSSNSQQGSNSGATSGGSAGNTTSMESSRVSTAQRNDLWTEIETTVKLLVGEKEGRSVVVSPQTGNIVLRALPREIRAVSDYLEATRISVQRQVMLEAKVVEVQLSDSERTGINWSAFKLGLSTRATGGAIAPGTSLTTSGTIGDGLITVNPGVAIDAAATAAGSLLGLAFQTRNFAAVLDFLGTQGNTQVLSSPRIATMNNQKAVLKVGTDDFFVTSISSTTTAVGNTTATTPNIGVQPFFSGISLDVTPNIDANGYITLHVHPSVSTVSERTKVINLGTQGSYSLPLASSQINESDAVVRAHDGNIIAIGGLMRQASVNSDSGIPGSEGTVWRKLLGGQTNRLSEKRELVILLKPTIVDPSAEDSELRRDALQRLLDWMENQPPLKQPTAARAAARPNSPVALVQPATAAPPPAPRDAGPPVVLEPVALDWSAMGQARPNLPPNRPTPAKAVMPPLSAGLRPPGPVLALVTAAVPAAVRRQETAALVATAYAPAVPAPAPATIRSAAAPAPAPAPKLAVLAQPSSPPRPAPLPAPSVALPQPDRPAPGRLSRRLAARPEGPPALSPAPSTSPGILMPRRVVPMVNPWQTALSAPTGPAPWLAPEALRTPPTRWLLLGSLARGSPPGLRPT